MYINQMWLDEQHNAIAKKAVNDRELVYAEKLNAKYGINMKDLTKATFNNDTKVWVPTSPNIKSFTDDGCRHYIYQGKHYRLSYLFHDNEWFEDTDRCVM